MAASVIVPTRNRGGMLLPCVEAILAGDVTPAAVIVVDQSDVPDPDIELLAAVDPTVHHVIDTGRGASRARNIGLRRARTPAVALIDDDVIADACWLGALLDGIRPGACVLRSGNVRGASGAGEGWSPSVANLESDRTVREPADEDVLFTSSMSMTMEVVERIGYFDERLGPGSPWPSAEDNDFAFRALRTGIPIELIAGATAVHLEWRTAEQLVALSRSYGLGQGAFYAKHFRHDRGHIARRASGQIATWSARVGRGLVRDRAMARREAAYLGGLALGAATWLARAHRLPAYAGDAPADATSRR